LIVVCLYAYTFALEINHTDIGTYNLLNKKLQPISMQFRLNNNGNKWKMEGRDNDTSDWANISCDKGCELRASTQKELNYYLKTLTTEEKQDKYEIGCIQNVANAFCKIVKKSNSSKIYTLVALVTGKPIPIFLKKIED